MKDSTAPADVDLKFMNQAIDLASLGQGSVEPNPMVGCVIVQTNDARPPEIVGQGWHQEFGGDHAEIIALSKAGSQAHHATAYISLEPCCHHGKTPPCVDALLSAGVRRVVVAQLDPFPQVAGKGVEHLVQAGVDVQVGICEERAERLNGPYLKLLRTGRPWIIAKWAMSLDGKLATRSQHSQWISNEQSRGVTHQLRSRVDAIVVGANTARSDDPRLTARPPGRRTAVRVVVDSRAAVDRSSQLVQTASEAPVLVACAEDAPPVNIQLLHDHGCEVLLCRGDSPSDRLSSLLDEFGQRRMTNVLVEGGAELLGSLFDMHEIDELHAFVSPKLVGGKSAPSPIAGRGREEISPQPDLEQITIRQLGADVYISGRVRHE